MERRSVSCHHFGPIGLVFVEYLMQYGLLLESVDVVGRLWHDEQVLLVAHEPAVRRLWHLVLLLRGTVMDLLQQVVLLLTHHQLSSFLLPLLELVLEGLCVDADATVGHDLLASVGGDAYSDATRVGSLHARVEGQQIVLEVDDFYVWLREWPAHHILFIQAPLVGNILVFDDRRRIGSRSLCLEAVQRFLGVVPQRAGSRARPVALHHYLGPALVLRGMLRRREALAKGLQRELIGAGACAE